MRRGLDLPDCEVATKIRPKYLRALEDEHFDLLPSPAYVRGFLRTYAEFLDLDGQLVIDEYESRYGVDVHDHERRGRPSGPGARVTSPGRRRTAANARHGRRPGGSSRRRTETQLLWVAIGGVLAVGLLVQMGIGKPKIQPPPLTSTDTTATTVATPDDPKLATPERPEAFSVQLTGVGPDGAWVEVRTLNASGKVVFSAILSDGQTRTFRIARSLWINTQNPAGLRVTVAGKDRPLSASGAYLVQRSGVRFAGGGTG